MTVVLGGFTVAGSMIKYWPHLTILAGLNLGLILFGVVWVLRTKRDSTSALAWCLAIVLLPVVGFLLFWEFGYIHVQETVKRTRQHRRRMAEAHPPTKHTAVRGETGFKKEPTPGRLARLALALNAFPLSPGNGVTLYADTRKALDALLRAIATAKQSVHLEFYIFRPDDTGREVLDALTARARDGVEVRVLNDAMGTRHMDQPAAAELIHSGGKIAAFLPLSPWRSRLRLNFRNHRKIAVVDSAIGFTGGMNIGDEYVGKNPEIGYWRDQFVEIHGPAVAGLQRIFVEDWHFARGETLDDGKYFPEIPDGGEEVVQIAESSADQQINTIREIYFAAMLSAKKRLWIASPYFVPDEGMLDALQLACLRGVDVRLLTIAKPDHVIAFYAGHYYFPDLLSVGAKIYEYTKGMMHSKIIMVDGCWGMVGSSNLDNRSMHLNYEAGCMLHSSDRVQELEGHFLADLNDAMLVDAREFAKRGFGVKLAETTCRLFSPIL